MRQAILIIFFFILIFYTATGNTAETKETMPEESSTGKRWEYLVVAEASNTNLKLTTNTSMRKESTGAFGRESFVLEQQLDKLGATGWELVSVLGSPNNPTFYFKRRK